MRPPVPGGRCQLNDTLLSPERVALRALLALARPQRPFSEPTRVPADEFLERRHGPRATRFRLRLDPDQRGGRKSVLNRVFVAAAACLATAVLAGPALADPPVRTEIDVSQVLTGATPCGTLRWDIHITGHQTTFFEDGVRRRVQAHIHEDNTITNLTTGESFREGPDSFMQTTYFNADGTLDRIVATGMAANVQGEQFKDVGRVVLVPLGGGRFDLVFSAGRHPLREAADDGRLIDALPGFCELFE
jgi:hypothetical protein